MKTEVIVFDLYNTLVKIEKNKHFFHFLYRISNQGFDLSTKAYKDLLLTKPLHEVIDLLPKDFESLLDTCKDKLEEELNSIFLFKNVKFVLEQLAQDYRVFLISNLASPYKKPFFDLGLDKYFENYIFSCDVGLVKPQKEIFQIIENNSGQKGSQILMIGDSEKSDIAGAKSMNWNYLKVCRNQSIKSNYEINDLSEIFSFVES